MKQGLLLPPFKVKETVTESHVTSPWYLKSQVEESVFKPRLILEPLFVPTEEEKLEVGGSSGGGGSYKEKRKIKK